jgi:tetratricopeptide (TPR) repeat protein
MPNPEPAMPSHSQLRTPPSTDTGLLQESPVAAARRQALAQLSDGHEVQALLLLFDLLAFAPDDPATLANLGDCYLAAGDSTGAQVFYEKALGFSGPHDSALLARCQLAKTATRTPVAGWLLRAGFPTGAKHVRKVLTQLPVGQPPQALMDLLTDIVNSPDPASLVRSRLDEVMAYLPMLIALSASQSENSGNSQSAEALARLANQALA